MSDPVEARVLAPCDPSPTPSTPSQPRLLAPLTAILALILGTGYALLLPPFQAPDESTHFLRAYDVAQGHLVNSGSVILPQQFRRLVNMFAPRLQTATGDTEKIRLDELTALLHQQLDTSHITAFDPRSASIHSVVPHLPTALGIRLALLFHVPPLALLAFGRLASVFFFAGTTYLALRILPTGELSLACVALLPMSLHQVASFSADAMTCASAFLLIAYALKLAVDSSVPCLSTRHYTVFGILILASALTKSNPWMPLVLAVIPAKKFGAFHIRLKWPIIILATVLGLSATAAWQRANQDNVARYVQERASRTIDISANTSAVLHHPVNTLGTFTKTVALVHTDIADQFVGYFGLLHIPPPRWLTWFCLAVLLLATTQSGARLEIWQRGWLIFLFLASVLTIYIFQIIIDMPRSYNQQMIAGPVIFTTLQGRYLISIAPMFLIALSGLPHPRFSRKVIYIGLAAIVFASFVAFYLISKTYYTGASTAAAPASTAIGVYREGMWILRSYDGRGDQILTPGVHEPEAVPVAGDWNGDGRDKLGTFLNGHWILDTNGDQKFDAHDTSFYFGGIPGDLPVTGDWNGDGKTKVGIYRKGLWILDVNGTHGNDYKAFAFGGLPEDIPVTGDWNGDGKTKVGVFRNGIWLLHFEGRETEKADKMIPFGGIPGDRPITGDWSGDGKCRLGIYRHGTWILSMSGDYRPGAKDRVFAFDVEKPGDVPVVLRSGKGRPTATAAPVQQAASATSPAAAILWVHDSAGKNQQSDGPRSLPSSSIETFHVRFVATATRTVRIHLHRKPGDGVIDWTSVRLINSRGQAVPLPNASFQSGALAPWMYYGTVQWKLQTPPTGLEESAGDGGVCQDVTGLTPGQTYDITATATRQ